MKESSVKENTLLYVTVTNNNLAYSPRGLKTKTITPLIILYSVSGLSEISVTPIKALTHTMPAPSEQQETKTRNLRYKESPPTSLKCLPRLRFYKILYITFMTETLKLKP